MKKLVVFLLFFSFLISGNISYAWRGDEFSRAVGAPPGGGSWTPGNGPKASSSVDSVKKDKDDLKALYEEFQKFWHVKDKDDLQDRFEEFLKSKNIYTKEIDNYDDFMEVWVDNYDEDLDFDDLYEIYDLDLNDTNDPDEYDILLDDDIDELYDDYLDDYIDEGDYAEYGEYFDEVYYDW